MIEIAGPRGLDPLEFEVVIREADGVTRHAVALTRATHARLAPSATPEALARAAFAFLLEREPKEAILSRFDIEIIARYFPEFERELPRYLMREGSRR